MFSKKTRDTFVYALIASITLPIEAFASNDEAQAVYEKAITSSSRVKEIHEDGFARRQEEARQLNVILDKIAENQNKDPEDLHQSVVHSLEQDKIVFEALNQQLTKYNPGEKGTTYQLKNNKMSIITDATLKLAKEGNLFFEILAKKLPEGYAIDPPTFNYFPESNHIYSNGKRGNALKSLLLKIWLIQNDQGKISQVGQLFDSSWLDTAPFVHITPLPSDFDVSTLQSSPHYFSDSQTPNGLLTIHNGYAFGGHRKEPRYPAGKIWGPHDCSSFVALYSKCNKVFSTTAQSQYYQEVNGLYYNNIGADIVKRFSPDIVKHWEDSKPTRQTDAFLQNMREIFSPLSPNPDPQTLKPGCVHAERSYKGVEQRLQKLSLEDSANPSYSSSAKAAFEAALSGTSGHTGFFLGTIGSGAETKALTITASRDLEDTGKEFIYGVEPRPLLSEPERMIMFFDIKN